VEGSGEVPEGRDRDRAEDRHAGHRRGGRDQASGYGGDRVDQVCERPARPDVERLDRRVAAQFAQARLQVAGRAALRVGARAAAAVADERLDLTHGVHGWRSMAPALAP
jgi:hypothetical protein